MGQVSVLWAPSQGCHKLNGILLWFLLATGVAYRGLAARRSTQCCPQLLPGLDACHQVLLLPDLSAVLLLSSAQKDGSCTPGCHRCTGSAPWTAGLPGQQSQLVASASELSAEARQKRKHSVSRSDSEEDSTGMSRATSAHGHVPHLMRRAICLDSWCFLLPFKVITLIDVYSLMDAILCTIRFILVFFVTSLWILNIQYLLEESVGRSV